MIEGKDVTLLADRGAIIKRKLVSVEDGVFFVCTDDEFSRSRRESREPVCIGFKREYVLDPKTADQ
jgi:hypothetical protein